MEKSASIWINLYNTLFLISYCYDELKCLESPIFEVLDELETSLINGLRDEALDFYESKSWIDSSVKTELINFRNHVNLTTGIILISIHLKIGF